MRALIMFMLLTLAIPVWASTSVVERVVPQIAEADELTKLVIDRGVVVVNINDLSDMRVGDGLTPGGVRVGFHTTFVPDFTGQTVIFGNGYTQRAWLSGWHLEKDGEAFLWASEQSINAEIQQTYIAPPNIHFVVLFDNAPPTNTVVRGSLDGAAWHDVTNVVHSVTNLTLYLSVPLSTNESLYSLSFPGEAGRRVTVRATLEADVIELGGVGISSWSQLFDGMSIGTDTLARAMADAVSNRVDSVEGRITAVEGAVISNIPPGVVTTSQTGTVTKTMLSPDVSDVYLRRDGSKKMTGHLDMDGYDVMEVASVHGQGNIGINFKDWVAENEDVMSGLNADRLDDFEASYFASSNALHLVSTNAEAARVIASNVFLIAQWLSGAAVQNTNAVYTTTVFKADAAFGWGNWNGRGFIDSNTVAAKYATTQQLAAVATPNLAAVLAKGGNMNAGALTGLNGAAITSQIPVGVLSAATPMTVWNSWTTIMEARVRKIETNAPLLSALLPFGVVGVAPQTIAVNSGAIAWWDATSEVYLTTSTDLRTISVTGSHFAISLETADLGGSITGSVWGVYGATDGDAIAAALALGGASSRVRVLAIASAGSGTNAASVATRHVGDVYYDR